MGRCWSLQAGRDANFGVGMGRKRRSQSSSQEGNNVRGEEGEMRKRSPQREEESTMMKAQNMDPMLRIICGITQPRLSHFANLLSCGWNGLLFREWHRFSRGPTIFPLAHSNFGHPFLLTRHPFNNPHRLSLPLSLSLQG